METSDARSNFEQLTDIQQAKEGEGRRVSPTAHAAISFRLTQGRPTFWRNKEVPAFGLFAIALRGVLVQTMRSVCELLLMVVRQGFRNQSCIDVPLTPSG